MSTPGTRQSAPAPTSLSARSRAFLRSHLGQSLKFLTVGGIVFLLDAAMYNLLVFWMPGAGWGHGVLHDHPLPAKVLTIAVASCFTYLGNRLWTFGDRPRPHTARSILAFVVVNVVAAGLQLACLAFSRYVLGLDSALADNVSGTLIGQIVSTSFRYVTYGRFVFPRERPAGDDDGSPDAPAPPHPGTARPSSPHPSTPHPSSPHPGTHVDTVD